MNHNIQKATIISVGSELVEGIRLNTNAPWLSKQLVEARIEIGYHLTVPDSGGDICQALSIAAKESDLIILTGGLGATSDDITKKSIARFLNLELEFNSDSWRKIQSKLRILGIVPRESDRQMSIFPQGSIELANSEGLAGGILLSHMNRTIIALPGPHGEVKAIFKEELVERLKIRPHKANPHKKWQLIGETETFFADMVERILSDTEIKVSYRFHRPYTEVKVRVPDDLSQIKYLEKLDSVLKPWTKFRGESDVLSAIFSRSTVENLTLYDKITHGLLAENLLRYKTQQSDFNYPSLHFIEKMKGYHRAEKSGDLFLSLQPSSQSEQWTLHFRYLDISKNLELKFPYKNLSREKKAVYAAELSLLQVLDWIS